MRRNVGVAENSKSGGNIRSMGIRRDLTLASDAERITYGKREKSG
jgi:hypothetical protein